MTLAAFDAYRDADARKLMIEFVMAQRSIDAPTAVTELRALNHVGLAYVYQDAIARAGRGNQVDYDPCQVGR
jgi:hypothetical protein